jgi:ferrochelatase
MPEGSPLAVWTRARRALAPALAQRGHDVLVRHAMRYGQPSVAQVMDELRAAGATRVLVLPLYPQYAAPPRPAWPMRCTSWALGARWVPELRSIGQYHDDPGYIDALAAACAALAAAWPRPNGWCSASTACPSAACCWAIPTTASATRRRGCWRERLGLPADEVLVTFQSRFGKAKWLEPYTEPTCANWRRKA